MKLTIVHFKFEIKVEKWRFTIPWNVFCILNQIHANFVTSNWMNFESIRTN